jgi:hypothetical protein
MISHTFIRLFAQAFIRLFAQAFIRLFAQAFIRLFAQAFIRLFAQAFIRLFTQESFGQSIQLFIEDQLEAEHSTTELNCLSQLKVEFINFLIKKLDNFLRKLEDEFLEKGRTCPISHFY